MGLRLFHVSFVCSQVNLIFCNPLKTAIGICGEMQTGIEGADGRGKVEACCAPWTWWWEDISGLLCFLDMMVRRHQWSGWLEIPLCLSVHGRGIARWEPSRPFYPKVGEMLMEVCTVKEPSLSHAHLGYLRWQQQQAGLASGSPSQSCWRCHCWTPPTSWWASASWETPGCLRGPTAAVPLELSKASEEAGAAAADNYCLHPD